MGRAPSIRCSSCTPRARPARRRACSTASGGYLLWAALTMKWTFDIKPADVFWCTADIGWVTGHTYIAYGPLAVGATEIVFEGVPTYPNAGRFWDMIANHKVTHLLHRADRDPLADQGGGRRPDGASEQLRPVQPAPARLGRRADQSGSLDVVLQECRPREMPDRRHLLADRNRRPHDHAAAGRNAHGAGLVHAAAAGHHGGDRRRNRARRAERAGRHPGGQASVAVDDPHHLERSRSASRRATSPKSWAARPISPATARSATRTPATSPSPAASTTC